MNYVLTSDIDGLMVIFFHPEILGKMKNNERICLLSESEAQIVPCRPMRGEGRLRPGGMYNGLHRPGSVHTEGRYILHF